MAITMILPGCGLAAPSRTNARCVLRPSQAKPLAHIRSRAVRRQRAVARRVACEADPDAAPVLCIGEALWDGLPLGLFLGGAPVNVAQHMAQLGVPTACVSCVGDDVLGEEIRSRLLGRGVNCDFLQTDQKLPTGFVKVLMGDNGIPSYDIVQPSAWDSIQATPELLAAAASAPAVIFGSLAQRDAASAATIQAVFQASSRRVFDVNLRPPFIEKDKILACMQDLYLMKVNDEELVIMAEWIGEKFTDEQTVAAAYAKKFNIQNVCVTRGGKGAALWIAKSSTWIEHPGFGVTPTDTVGAGDSFLARLLSGLLDGEAPDSALAGANALGAFVATQNGATPIHNKDAINKLLSGSVLTA